MLFKKSLMILACVLLTQSIFVSCGKKDADSSAPDNAVEAKDSAKGDSAKADKDAAKLVDGKWPTAIYSKYGIDEITTKGKVVFTQLPGESPYQYQVYYHGVTQDELKAWVDKLVAKGLRIHDRDKERLNGKYDHDTMIYFADEKQPYRMRISYDFANDMDFEVYDENPNPAFTITEKKDGDDSQLFVIYNLSISLNAINKDTESKGSFDSLGLKAEDLKISDSVRNVTMSEGQNGGSMKIHFYTDHFTTKEDSEACRKFIIDKLAEKGAKFTQAMSGKDVTAAELKDGGLGTYGVEINGKKYMLMADPDNEINEFGGGYGVRLMVKK